MTTQYTITSGSFLFDYYILPSLGGPQFTGVSSPADVASFLSSGVSDVNTIQSIGFNAIEILSNSSDGLAAVGTTVGVYGRYVPVLGYGLAALESAARASEGDYAAATIAGIANTSGIYVGASSADAIAASRGGILIGSFLADGVALEGAAGLVGVGGGFLSGVGTTLAVGAALKFEYNTFTGEIGNHDPGQLIPVPVRTAMVTRPQLSVATGGSFLVQSICFRLRNAGMQTFQPLTPAELCPAMRRRGAAGTIGTSIPEPLRLAMLRPQTITVRSFHLRLRPRVGIAVPREARR